MNGFWNCYKAALARRARNPLVVALLVGFLIAIGCLTYLSGTSVPLTFLMVGVWAVLILVALAAYVLRFPED